MADIFSRAGQDFKGAFASDAARIAFAAGGSGVVGDAAGQGGVGLLTQSLAVNYNQGVTRLYEIGTNFTYLVAGRTQGQIGLNRILGPRPVQIAFYTKYGNVCNAASNNLNFEADTGCPQGNDPNNNVGAQGGLVGTYSFAIRASVIVGININTAAQDMIINEQLQLMFVSLELSNAQ